MRASASRRTLLAVLVAVSVVGCAAKPPERPIVLRHYHPERRVAHRHRPTPAGPSAKTASGSEPDLDPALKPDQDEAAPASLSALFRRFDAYLSQTGSAP